MDSTLSVHPPETAVREQLARILASPLFKHSRHYPALLKYVVEQTLDGRTAHLKERALGVEVFGRDSSYDTNLDPVVRTSACEVRKRIAQYYHDESRASELRIELPSGSYIPEFRFSDPPAAVPARESLPPEPVVDASTHPSRLLGTTYGAVGLIAAVVLMGVAAAGLGPETNPIEQFWAPVWNAADSVMLCVAPPNVSDLPPHPTYLDVMHWDHMPFADALTMARLDGLLTTNQVKTDIRRGSNVTLEDFRRSPAVLVGAFDNPWTIRLADQLRFTFRRTPDLHEGFIHDRQDPSRTIWYHDPNIPYSQVMQDYAIVSRFVDTHTEKMVVVVAGMGKDGTSAAGEFVTERRYLKMLADSAPRGWERRNLQVVLQTEVINGNVGPPRIVTSYFW